MFTIDIDGFGPSNGHRIRVQFQEHLLLRFPSRYLDEVAFETTSRCHRFGWELVPRRWRHQNSVESDLVIRPKRETSEWHILLARRHNGRYHTGYGVPESLCGKITWLLINFNWTRSTDLTLLYQTKLYILNFCFRQLSFMYVRNMLIREVVCDWVIYFLQFGMK